MAKCNQLTSLPFKGLNPPPEFDNSMFGTWQSCLGQCSRLSQPAFGCTII